MTIIEVQGVNYLNKGAQLMLEAIVQHFATAHPRIDLGIGFRTAAPGARHGEATLRRIMYVQNERFRGMNSLLDAAVSAVPRPVRRERGIVREREVAGVIDASGFRYSDQWGSKTLLEMVRRVERFRNAGKPFIFMPQAFGPFRNPSSQSAARDLVAASSLIFARDSLSLEFLQNCAGTPSQLRKAPDFTALVRPVVTPDMKLPDKPLLVVPNSRMIDKVGEQAATAYMPLLKDVLEFGGRRGFSPVVLVHDAQEDFALARRLKEEASVDVLLISDADPLRLKGYLSMAEIVVSSRFHANVGALSSGTPTLALGWSHKYAELMADYDCEGLNVKVTEGPEFLRKLEELMDDHRRAQHRQKLLERASQQKFLSSMMWRDVDALIGGIR